MATRGCASGSPTARGSAQPPSNRVGPVSTEQVIDDLDEIELAPLGIRNRVAEPTPAGRLGVTAARAAPLRAGLRRSLLATHRR